MGRRHTLCGSCKKKIVDFGLRIVKHKKQEMVHDAAEATDLSHIAVSAVRRGEKRRSARFAAQRDRVL
jgi:hypothetical protein